MADGGRDVSLDATEVAAVRTEEARENGLELEADGGCCCVVEAGCAVPGSAGRLAVAEGSPVERRTALDGQLHPIIFG